MATTSFTPAQKAAQRTLAETELAKAEQTIKALSLNAPLKITTAEGEVLQYVPEYLLKYLAPALKSEAKARVTEITSCMEVILAAPVSL